MSNEMSAIDKAAHRWGASSVTFGTPRDRFVPCPNCGRKRLHRQNCGIIDRNVTPIGSRPPKTPGKA